MGKKKYKVVYERTETYREVFLVDADSPEEASELGQEMNDEHDWTENEVIHGEEREVFVAEL